MARQHSRQRHRELASALSHPIVVAADLVPTPDGPVTELSIRGRHDGLPPRILQEIADHNMVVQDVEPCSGGDYYHVEII